MGLFFKLLVLDNHPAVRAHLFTPYVNLPKVSWCQVWGLEIESSLKIFQKTTFLAPYGTLRLFSRGSSARAPPGRAGKAEMQTKQQIRNEL